MSPQQQVLIEFSPPPRGIVVVNDRVNIRTEEAHRVVSVHGVVLAHYDVGDRAAEA